MNLKPDHGARSRRTDCGARDDVEIGLEPRLVLAHLALLLRKFPLEREQPRFARKSLPEQRLDALELGLQQTGLFLRRGDPRFQQRIDRLGLGRAEHEQHVANRNLLALADADLRDDAAFEMLDRLAVGLEIDLTRRDGRARQRRMDRPCSDAAEEGGVDQQTCKPEFSGLRTIGSRRRCRRQLRRDERVGCRELVPRA